MSKATTAIGYHKNLPVSDPESLTSQQVDVPVPGPHDLLVEVQAVSVNPVDVKLRAGASADGFRVLGFDAAGTVRDVGANVTLFRPGDEVFYAGSIDRPGTNQQLHLVDERIVGPKPTAVSFADAASLPLTAITAWESLFDRFGLTSQSSGTLLVAGATGGVGSVMLQLAEALLPGVRVVATASDAERERWVRELGAEEVVNHHADLAAQVLDVAPDGVDWLFTAHSEGQIETYAQIVRPFGQIVAIDDGPRDVSALKPKSIAWHWELMFTRPLYQTPDMIEQHHLLNQVSRLLDDGRLRPTTTRTLTPITPETLREAHQQIEEGRVVGKIVLHDWP
ncbi:zinc-binding alcohol dehydrogenase family protein [Phytoactinopolyspora halotolerans]|uniref:Zinc-type alcohol dehydrogenase-like protein n=1 Tax=Phytoactinopolyspora halotolerans TaxID=1981512 RepID=A0A6L9SGY3_9ACTN|nr:zinc-binding alcohol dehydrogenase family protein [Phytoactinopolyspora halotolerans]NEE03894.1 zinc-binding alcohol dehydrogenase family protein [Phytoactinopolyspora halotolerans]